MSVYHCNVVVIMLRSLYLCSIVVITLMSVYLCTIEVIMLRSVCLCTIVVILLSSVDNDAHAVSKPIDFVEHFSGMELVVFQCDLPYLRSLTAE